MGLLLFTIGLIVALAVWLFLLFFLAKSVYKACRLFFHMAYIGWGFRRDDIEEEFVRALEERQAAEIMRRFAEG